MEPPHASQAPAQTPDFLSATSVNIDRARIQARMQLLKQNSEIAACRNARVNSVMHGDILITPKSGKRVKGMTKEMQEFCETVYRPFAIMAHDYLLAAGFVPWCVEQNKSGQKFPVVIPIPNYQMQTRVVGNIPKYTIECTTSADPRVFFIEPPVLSSVPQGVLASVEMDVWRIERIKRDLMDASYAGAHPRVFTQRTNTKKAESSVLYAELGVFSSADESYYSRNVEENRMLAKSLEMGKVSKEDGVCLPQDHTLVQQTHPKVYNTFADLDAKLAELVCSAFGVPYSFLHTTTRYSSDRTAHRAFDFTVRAIKTQISSLLEEVHLAVFNEEVEVSIPFVPSLTLEDIFGLADRGLIGYEAERMLAISACGLEHSQAFNGLEENRKKRLREENERVRSLGEAKRGRRSGSPEREELRGPASGDRGKGDGKARSAGDAGVRG